MILNNASLTRRFGRRRPGSGREAARTGATAVLVIAASFVSPLHPTPAAAQGITIGGNGNSGLNVQLSVLQSLGSPVYAGLGLGNQSVANLGLTLGPNGDLYGTTATGGLNNEGSVYEVTPSGQIQLLHSFGGLLSPGSGITPSGPLTLGPDGNLYGITSAGGANGDGTVFQVSPSGVVTTLHSFTGGPTDGSGPTGVLNISATGVITGTTSSGGAGNHGTVYQIADQAGQDTESLLHSFTGGVGDGSNPASGVIQAVNGDLYGTTTGGGASGAGTVFQIADAAGQPVESLVHSFAGGTGDGSDPVGGLIQTASGALAGTTSSGGSAGDGTVYEIANAATQPVESVLGSLSGTTGSDPVSSLVQMADGSLLGTASMGGANGGGTVFDLLPNGTLSTIQSFTGNNGIVGSLLNNIGSTPASPLIVGAGDTLYGVTNAAGLNGAGSIYKVVLPSSVTGQVSTRFDVNGDGYADILFFNNQTGALAYWLMNDQNVLQYSATVGQVDPSSGWMPVGQPDAAGTGQPDILFWNQNTGALSIWDLAPDSETVSQYGATFATVSDTHWKPSAIANDDGNGNYEIVFQNTSTGDVNAWHMSATTVTSYGAVSASLGANSPWQLVGAPDLNKDGISDYLFWNASDGEVSYWTMNGDSVQEFNNSFGQVPDTSWHLVGAPDLNNDGEADLLWENVNTGDLSRWQMNGSSVTQYGDVFGTTGSIASQGWEITGER